MCGPVDTESSPHIGKLVERVLPRRWSAGHPGSRIYGRPIGEFLLMAKLQEARHEYAQSGRPLHRSCQKVYDPGRDLASFVAPSMQVIPETVLPLSTAHRSFRF
jgi:hypothetical protein